MDLVGGGWDEINNARFAVILIISSLLCLLAGRGGGLLIIETGRSLMNRSEVIN